MCAQFREPSSRLSTLNPASCPAAATRCNASTSCVNPGSRACGTADSNAMMLLAASAHCLPPRIVELVGGNLRRGSPVPAPITPRMLSWDLDDWAVNCLTRIAALFLPLSQQSRSRLLTRDAPDPETLKNASWLANVDTEIAVCRQQDKRCHCATQKASANCRPHPWTVWTPELTLVTPFFPSSNASNHFPRILARPGSPRLLHCNTLA